MSAQLRSATRPRSVGRTPKRLKTASPHPGAAGPSSGSSELALDQFALDQVNMQIDNRLKLLRGVPDVLDREARGCFSFAVPESVADAMRCIVCTDYFNTPMVMTCGHTLCAGCADRVSEMGESTCPTCRAPFTPDDLKPNFAFSVLMDAFPGICSISNFPITTSKEVHKTTCRRFGCESSPHSMFTLRELASHQIEDGCDLCLTKIIETTVAQNKADAEEISRLKASRETMRNARDAARDDLLRHQEAVEFSNAVDNDAEALAEERELELDPTFVPE